MSTARKGKKPALVLGAAVLLGVAAAGVLYRHDLRTWYVLATRFERLAVNVLRGSMQLLRSLQPAAGEPDFGVRDRRSG